MKIRKYLNKNKSDYLFITAPENVAWLLNIRGYDSPTSPYQTVIFYLQKKNMFSYLLKKIKQQNF